MHDPVAPSEETISPWLVTMRRSGEYPQRTEEGGKWLVFVPASEVDEVWVRIREATEEGRLGDSAKAATAASNQLARDPDRKVICVYTYDSNDRADVIRVRDELRELGITWKIPYKTDKDTRRGKYRHTGYRRISKYYE